MRVLETGGVLGGDVTRGRAGVKCALERVGRSLAAARKRRRWRKVRTPQGRMLANGQAQQAARPKATESGTESTPPKRRRFAGVDGKGEKAR